MSKPIQLNSEAIATSGGTNGSASETIIIKATGKSNFDMKYIDHGNGMSSLGILDEGEEDSTTIGEPCVQIIADLDEEDNPKTTGHTAEITLHNYTITTDHTIGCVIDNVFGTAIASSISFPSPSKMLIRFNSTFNAGQEPYLKLYVVAPTWVLPRPVPITVVPPGQS